LKYDNFPAQMKRKLLLPFERQRSRVARHRRYLRTRVRIRREERRLFANPAVGLVYRTLREMSADDATHMAAGLAYYAVLSLFPLTVGLISLLGMVLDSETLEGEVFIFFQTYLPGSKELLSANINAAGNIRGFLGVISFLGLFWSASLLFGAISRSVNRAWDIHQDRPFYIDKLRHIAMAFSVAPLFLMSISTTAALQFLGNHDVPVIGRTAFLDHDWINILTRPLPFVFSLTIFLLIYKFTPNTRTYWQYVWPGALLAAVLFEVSKSVFVFYLDNFANYERVYGSMASVIVLLGWAYISGFILILGAEFSSEYGRMRRGVERGRLIIDPNTRRPPRGTPPPADTEV
jgi:membrane protein